MNPNAHDRVFAGSIPTVYQRDLVPLLFEPYAVDMAARVAACEPASVLEIAAGTGVVTRRLAAQLPHSTALVATDLNPAMLDVAATLGSARPVVWQQADAMALPFADASFDLVLCQFGAMFFPERPRAFDEVRRVLRPGGTFVFNVWDAIEHNEFANVAVAALAEHFPGDPPRFLARVPHGYHDPVQIGRDLLLAGFVRPPGFVTLTQVSRAASPRIPAVAMCHGTPMRSEIEHRAPDGLAAATDVVAQALARRFGTGAVSGRMQAVVVTVLK